MADTKSHQLAEALNTFLATSPDVEATAVISFDGLTMASALPDEMEDDRVGAMSAALLSLGEQAARGLGRGDLQQLFVEADEGFVFLMSAKDQAVLVAVTGREAKIGFIIYEMRRAAWEVGSVLEGPSTTSGRAPDAEAGRPAGGLAAELVDAFAGDAEPEPEYTGAHAAPPNGPAAGVAASPELDRDPFGDGDLDDPYYVAVNGRSGPTNEPRV